VKVDYLRWIQWEAKHTKYPMDPTRQTPPFPSPHQGGALSARLQVIAFISCGTCTPVSADGPPNSAAEGLGRCGGFGLGPASCGPWRMHGPNRAHFQVGLDDFRAECLRGWTLEEGPVPGCFCLLSRRRAAGACRLVVWLGLPATGFRVLPAPGPGKLERQRCWLGQSGCDPDSATRVMIQTRAAGSDLKPRF
jgi:hypothetical protein